MRALNLAIACLVLTGLTGCSFFLGPSTRPPPDVTVQPTPELIARGEYLTHNVMACVDCHSPRDKGLFAMPPKKGMEFAGGECFGEEQGMPGKVCVPNITQDKESGLGQWTDGEIMRAVREGVSRDGRALFPFMPYTYYRSMSDEDLHAVIAYLRTVKPVQQQVARSEFGFFFRHIMNTFPEPLEGPVSPPSRASSVEYGRYLTTMGSCKECHTPRGSTGIKEDLAFSGGQEFNFSGVVHVRSANITPDLETGIGKMTRDQFISRFHSFKGVEPEPVSPARQTVMPWPFFAGMSEEDLGAIYDYLRTVKPLENKVEHFPEAAKAAGSGTTTGAMD
jgi:mono/diheme cytochrome c family protein